MQIAFLRTWQRFEIATHTNAPFRDNAKCSSDIPQIHYIHYDIANLERAAHRLSTMKDVSMKSCVGELVALEAKQAGLSGIVIWGYRQCESGREQLGRLPARRQGRRAVEDHQRALGDARGCLIANMRRCSRQVTADRAPRAVTSRRSRSIVRAAGICESAADEVPTITESQPKAAQGSAQCLRVARKFV